MTAKANPAWKAITTGLKACPQTERKNHWFEIKFDNIDPLMEAWKALSHRQKIKALKDKRWNHYPLSSWTSGSPKRYGSAIKEFVESILLKDEGDAEILRKHSVGIFAIFTIDLSPSKTRIKVAKRNIASKDARLRGRCAKILPIKYMKYFVNDKNYSIRNTAIRRVGFDNCYNLFLPSKATLQSLNSYYGGYGWLAYQAIRHASLEEVEELLPLISSSTFPTRLVESILAKIPKEDILYYLNNANVSERSSKIIQAKLR
jgi:hypothetical protein